MGILAQDDRTLESGMVDLHNGILAVLLFIDAHQFGKKRTVGIWVPTAIAATCLHLHASHREAARYHCCHIVLHILARTSWQEFDESLSALDVDDGKVA